MERTIPQVNFVVPRFIPRGFLILAGRPKVGKSYLALLLAIAVAGGWDFLDEPSDRGDVLFLGLEDDQLRLQNRTRQMLAGRAPPANLHFATTCRRLDEGGIDALSKWCDDVRTPRLIVIDIFARVRRQSRSRQLYLEDYESGMPLKTLADARGMAVLAIMHTRKELAVEDPFDAISATTGLAGVADSVLMLDRNSKGDRLYARGRDQAEMEVYLRRDASMGWSVLGDAKDVDRSEIRTAIREVLKSNDGALTPKEIAFLTGRDHDTVKHTVLKMVKSGDIDRDGHGKYRYPHSLRSPGTE